MMPERKRRVKTGCLTCRQRRVKCDERRPSCQRCEAANISCDGYERPRKLAPPGQSKAKSNFVESEPSRSILPVAVPLITPTINSLTAYPKPHQRARDILGYQQYSSHTVELLFRHEHLSFWRDHLLGAALETEYIFDTVIALGIMHSAVVISCEPDSKSHAVDSRVAAFQKYANALKVVSETCRKCHGQPTETLVAVLLLLTYFEVSELLSRV
jgi:hypothetical protein